MPTESTTHDPYGLPFGLRSVFVSIPEVEVQSSASALFRPCFD